MLAFGEAGFFNPYNTMETTKSEIKTIALGILFSPNPPCQIVDLDKAMASALAAKSGLLRYEPDGQLFGENWLMFNEVLWELIVDKIITPGMTSVHTDLPWFRLHSQASENLKRSEQVQTDSGH
jgi:hypothetical protein